MAGPNESFIQRFHCTLSGVIISSIMHACMHACRSEGLNPVQCRHVDTYLSSPALLISEKEESLLHTLQGMFRNRLSGRASKTLVGLGQHLKANAEDDIISFLQLQLSLRKFHISLTTEVSY